MSLNFIKIEVLSVNSLWENVLKILIDDIKRHFKAF